MPARNFEDYIIEAEHKTAFLRYVVSAKDAANQCLLKFKTTARSRTYTRDALDSIHMINAGLLAAIMGNFETFQKYLFANMFEYSIYLNHFELQKCLKSLKESVKAEKSTKFEVDFTRIGILKYLSVWFWLTNCQIGNLHQ